MQLRNHPIMMYFGYTRWPPTWIDYQGTCESTLQGEVGVLRRARCYPYNHRQIFLTIEHEGAEYTGCIIMEYEFMGEYMLKFFKDCTDMTIESIGSLEIPIAFETLKKAQAGR